MPAPQLERDLIMGLLDAVLGAVGGAGGGGGAQGGLARAAPEILAALMQQFGGAQGGGGGLAGLVQQLSQGGLGEAVQSWVSTGANLPVSAGQLESALGGGQLAQLAQQFGVNSQDLSGMLAEHLPQMVDKLTPQGQLPQGDLGGLLGSLSGLLKG
jgi:uncharacterized protein YidB (DUF937 family)